MTSRLRLTEIAADLRLRPAEVVTIAAEICRQYAQGEIRGIPSPGIIHITREGQVVAQGPMTRAEAVVASAGHLLEELLPGVDAPAEYRASGGLRLVIARALGTLDLPPYSGLGVYGGIATGTVAAWLYARYKRVPFLRWADIVAPGLFVMQAIARWGNFFNQELYGTPTKLPWGIPIDCAHRIAAYPCSSAYPESTLFHPLFLYESLSGVVGAVALIWLGFHARKSLRPGDLLLLFFVWYGMVRFVLETFRHDNWTFFGVPTAQIVSLLFVIPSLVILAWRHRRDHPLDDPPSRPEVATWGAIGRPVEPGEVDDELEDEDGPDDEDDDGTEYEDEADHLDEDVNDVDGDAIEDAAQPAGNETPPVDVDRTDDEPDPNVDRTDPATT